MQTIINILVFFVILGAIVLIHELGHFLTAKLFGVYWQILQKCLENCPKTMYDELAKTI